MALSLTSDYPRAYASGVPTDVNDLVVKASTTVYQGQVLASSATENAGLVLPFDVAGTWTTPFFVGFAETSVTQTASSTYRVKVRSKGRVILSAITGADSADDISKTVYASNDNTFTLTAGSNIAIGKIAGYVSGEGFHVQFEAAASASV